MSLCFAYGSNLSLEQMRSRCPGAEFVATARLPAHRLAFTRWSTGWDGGVADLVPAGDSSVWGALYELSEEDLDSLDLFEGVPRAYQRITLEVIPVGGRPVRAWAYVVVDKKPEMLPSFRYWRAIVEGSEGLGFPPDYRAFLEFLPHSPP